MTLLGQHRLDHVHHGALAPLRGHLGTSLGAVDADGNLVEQTEGDAFGVLDQLTGAKQAHLYAGEYWDQESQLLYLRARWYDPRIGRFVSADPFEGKQEDTRSLNRYVYANGDPVHATDPTGQTTSNELGAVGDVQGSLTTTSVPSATGQFAGRAAVEAGKSFEKKILEAIQSCIRPGAKIERISGKMRASDGRLAMPDFLLSIGNKFKILEVKTKLPSSKLPEAIERAARQLDAALHNKYPAAILSRTAHKDSTFARRKDDIERLLGGNAGLATYLNGTLAVVAFVAEFVVEECLTSALQKR